MPKVVTSEGLLEFVQTGKSETIAPDKRESRTAAAEPLETKQEPQVVDLTADKPTEKTPAQAQVDDEEGFTDEEKAESERVRRLIGKKHRALKQEEALRKKAQEEASDAEGFAKNQYERARLAEERAEALDRELKSTKANPNPEGKESEGKQPTIKDYTDQQGNVDWDKYTDAKADYAAKTAVAEERARQAQEIETGKRVQAEEQFKARLDKAKVKYPDFIEVLTAAKSVVPNAVLQYITESEYGADISYHLAKHPDLAEKLSKLSPIRAIAEVGKLETSFETPVNKTDPAARTSERGGAPPPITPISGTGSVNVVTDPSKMDYKQLREYERKRALEKKRR